MSAVSLNPEGDCRFLDRVPLVWEPARTEWAIVAQDWLQMAPRPAPSAKGPMPGYVSTKSLRITVAV